MILIKQLKILFSKGFTKPNSVLESPELYRPKSLINLLAILYALPSAFTSAYDTEMLLGEDGQLFLFLIPSLFIGFILIKIILPGIYFYTGRIWKGKASFADVQRAVLFSGIPTLLVLPLLIIELVTDEIIFESSLSTWSYITQFISLILLVAYIIKVQNFSRQIAILNVFLPVVFAYVLLAALAQMLI